MQLLDAEKNILLNAARDSIKAVFKKSDAPTVNFEKYSGLNIKAGAFVTLTIQKDLRGCIGYIYTETNLFETVCDAAKQAAFRDPRFLPLSEPQRISNYDEIILGKHGLILNHLGRRGLLLPQVATENKFNLENFLCAICEKAGFESFLWQKGNLNIDVFTAEIFSEEGERKKSYVSG